MGIKHRIYEDYFKKSRLGDYKEILITAKKYNYQMMGILDFYERMKDDPDYLSKNKVLINRHDIDTSPRVARKIFEIEKEVYGQEGSATYYFRKSTIDRRLISEIEQYGYETGYHYEQLATYEKKHKLRSAEKLREALPEMRKQFFHDLKWYRKYTGTVSKTIASHGDFINTKLNIQSAEILQDSVLRRKAEIIVEAYDEIIEKNIICRYADQALLNDFSQNVINAMTKNTSCILILSHPRNIERDIIATTIENLKRLLEGILYRKR